MTGGPGYVALIAALAIVPLVVLTLTSFVKISVVLSLLRNAIGAPDAPSGLVVTGLSLILTFFVMAPVATEMVHAASASSMPKLSVPKSTAPNPTVPNPSAPNPTAPKSTAPNPTAMAPAAPAAPLDLEDALEELVPAAYRPQIDAAARAIGPLRAFLARHASPRDRETFTELAARMGRPASGDALWVLAPAFVTTELREAFAIAVLIFVPFLVIDLVVGLGLAALGLTATSPQAIALPFKLLLFVSVDGWRLLIDGLLRGYV
jgi:type III secretion protein R